MELSIQDWGAIGESVAAIAVLITLIYLSMQVRQANAHARLEVRRTMFEHDHRELYRLVEDPEIWECFIKDGPLAPEEKTKFVFYLTANMRSREWEWQQYKAGLVTHTDLEVYDEVTLVHLGHPKALKWWESLGKSLSEPSFVAHVEELLNANTPSDAYYRAYRKLEL